MNKEIESSLRNFIDKYCDTDELDDLYDDDDIIKKLPKIKEVATSIMNFCDKLAPETNRIESRKFPFNSDIGLASFTKRFLFESCLTINSKIYWRQWEKRGDTCGMNHPGIVQLKTDINDICLRSNKGERQPHMYIDDGSDIEKLDNSLSEPRRLNAYCPINHYHGNRSQTDSTVVSQIRPKTCQNKDPKKKGTMTDVPVIMYHALFDHCVQNFALRKNLMKTKNRESFREIIREDLETIESHVPLKYIILDECIIRVKMTMFLRFFHAICCTGKKDIDDQHESAIITLSYLMDSMEYVKDELLREISESSSRKRIRV